MDIYLFADLNVFFIIKYVIACHFDRFSFR